MDTQEDSHKTDEVGLFRLFVVTSNNHTSIAATCIDSDHSYDRLFERLNNYHQTSQPDGTLLFILRPSELWQVKLTSHPIS